MDSEANDVKATGRRWTQRRDTPRALRAEETRRTLILAARDLFTEHGYHAVGIRDVCDRAGVSRGTFSHYFPEKIALFETVFALVEEDLNAEVAGALAMERTTDVWAIFCKSIQLFLDAAASHRDVQRITLVDGPSVLGWAQWRAIEERFSLGAFTLAIQAAMDGGRIRRAPVESLAHLILGSVMEAGLLVANAERPSAKRQDVGHAMDEMLAGLVAPAESQR